MWEAVQIGRLRVSDAPIVNELEANSPRKCFASPLIKSKIASRGGFSHDTFSDDPSVESHQKLERFLTEHFLLAFWIGLLAGLFSFFTVLSVAGAFAESFLRHSLLGETCLYLIAAVAGAYVCAHVAKETPLFACACFGIPLAFFLFIGFTFSMRTPDWYFYLRGVLVLLGSLVGYVLGTPGTFLHLRKWLKGLAGPFC